MYIRSTVAVAAILALSGTATIAQGALVGVDNLDDRIDTIQEGVNDALTNANARDRSQHNQYAQGWSGSVALGLSATSGNTDTADFALAGRFRYGAGSWNHTLGFAAEFAEDNGTRNKEEFFVTYDANRYVNDQFYVFGLGSLRYDNFGSNKMDAFVGFCPGYRIINDAKQSWRVQFGPGYRYVKDQVGTESSDWAAILSSRYQYKLNDTTSLSLDTDVLYSNADTLLTNDLGVNFKVTDRVSTRVSYRTEWNSDPLPGLSSTDNALGVSLVYGF